MKWVCECGADFPEDPEGKAFWQLFNHIKESGGAANGHRRLGLFDEQDKLLAKNPQEAMRLNIIRNKNAEIDDPEPESDSGQDAEVRSTSTGGNGNGNGGKRGGRPPKAESGGGGGGRGWQDSTHPDFMQPEIKSRATAKLTFDVGGGKLQFPHWVLAYALVLMPNFTRDTGENYSHTAEGFSNFITDTLRESFRKMLPFAMRDKLHTADATSKQLIVKSYIATLESLDDAQLASFIVQGAAKLDPVFARQVRAQLDETAAMEDDGDAEGQGE